MYRLRPNRRPSQGALSPRYKHLQVFSRLAVCGAVKLRPVAGHFVTSLARRQAAAVHALKMNLRNFAKPTRDFTLSIRVVPRSLPT
jgi:hypothetical protein